MAEIKIGDRVKVEYEGVVRRFSYGDTVIVVRDEDGKTTVPLRPYCTLIEPAYEVGAVYQDAVGRLYYRRAGTNPGGRPLPWKCVAGGLNYHDGHPVRPLVKLVPEVTA